MKQHIYKRFLMIVIFAVCGIFTANVQANDFGNYFLKHKSDKYQMNSMIFELTNLSISAPQNNYYYWGAIAYSFSSGADGASWDYSTESEAARTAMRSCGRSDCRVLVTVESGCSAIAVSGGNGWGGGYGYNHSAARSAALNTCKKYGNKECRIASSICTSIDD